eukprot:GFKZ01012732.1.p1 GENE.GFKZ01012732.1~~GFKZ01012732.1.p1  ORF type:complete len:298 (-),score=74.41 GFKZ01012732.1:706-1599(-)
MPPLTPKPEPLPAAPRLARTTKPPSPPRRQKPKPVIYKSSALNRAAPSLVAAADPARINSTRAIQQANEEAERVRDAFKLEKCGPDIDVGDGDDESTNARKYERRLLMNRHSAAASRVRREAYTKALEAQLVQHEELLKRITVMYEMEKEKNRRMMEEEGDGAVEVVEEEASAVGGDSEADDIDFEAAASAGLAEGGVAIMESQTEDNVVGDLDTGGVMDVGVGNTAGLNGVSAEAVEPAPNVLFPLMKSEELLLGDETNGDLLQPPMPHDALMELFLSEEGLGEGFGEGFEPPCIG